MVICRDEEQTEGVMSYKRGRLFLLLACVFGLFSGCGQTPPAGTQSAEDGGGGNTEFITVSDAKSAVLKNAGFSEEEVRFVRGQLEKENGVSGYDIEFICEDAEYDYTVDALTGEILSMRCEAGEYDLTTVPSQDAQTPPAPAGEQTGAEQPDGEQNQQEGQYIGVEAAKQAALNHAGLDADAVRFAHARLEFDDGYWKYDVEFHQDNMEYDYDIDALTGEILSCEQDADYRQGLASAAGEQITLEEAVRIALEYAGVDQKDAQRLETEFDYDDGRAEYGIEWHVGRTEYSCDIDAATGEVLSFERDVD